MGRVNVRGDDIDAMFTWARTPQGHGFWCGLQEGEVGPGHPLYGQHKLFKEIGIPQ